MSGLDAASSWTHLAAGLVIEGIGSGLVNPPLASTAVGVVIPERSGMTSGISTTFRQIGLAVGVAVYGTIFTAALHGHIAVSLTRTRVPAGRAGQIVASIQQGNANHAIASVPAGARAELVDAIRASFASSLNELLVISGALALIGAICALALIRRKDFIANTPGQQTDDTDTSASHTPTLPRPRPQADPAVERQMTPHLDRDNLPAGQAKPSSRRARGSARHRAVSSEATS